MSTRGESVGQTNLPSAEKCGCVSTVGLDGEMRKMHYLHENIAATKSQ